MLAIYILLQIDWSSDALYCYEQLSGCILQAKHMMVKVEEALAEEEQKEEEEASNAGGGSRSVG